MPDAILLQSPQFDRLEATLASVLEMIERLCVELREDDPDAEAIEAMGNQADALRTDLEHPPCMCDLYGYAMCQACQDDVAKLEAVHSGSA